MVLLPIERYCLDILLAFGGLNPAAGTTANASNKSGCHKANPRMVYRLSLPRCRAFLRRQAPDDRRFRPVWSCCFSVRALLNRFLAAIEIVNFGKS